MKWLGYIITIEETDIYISGDTDITEESSSVSCDIAMLPVGGFYTVDPEQAAELAGAIALGYPDETPAPRPRKKLEDIVEFRY